VVVREDDTTARGRADHDRLAFCPTTSIRSASRSTGESASGGGASGRVGRPSCARLGRASLV